MFVHLVLFKWKDDTDPKVVHRIMADIRAMKSRMSSIIGLRCGENNSNGSEYTHALVVSFKDLKSFENYMRDPEHKKIISIIQKYQDKILVMDFEDHN
jgi:hypothetical protein